MTIKTRPLNFNDYIGQDDIKEQLNIYSKAAKMRGNSLDHVLLYGAPGLGKTTLANIVGNNMDVNVITMMAPTINSIEDVKDIIFNLNDGDILFIDEIHRLSMETEESLYSVMEDFEIDSTINGDITRLDIPKITIIGATTRSGMLSRPFRDRFQISMTLKPYNIDDLSQIIINNANNLNADINKESALELAKRSRGTPRLGINLLNRSRDYADILNDGVIDNDIVNKSMKALKIDNKGLNESDRYILKTIINDFNNEPVGLDTLSASTDIDKGTITDVIEPYLIRIGMLTRSKQGRIATDKAYKHLNIDK